MQSRSGIYFILNKISLKLYIGSAVYLVARKSKHFTDLAKNKHYNEHLQRAYNKYGHEAFDFIIIEFVERSNLIEREAYYIAKHRATEEEFGYNKCAIHNGMTGRKHSAETIEKMKISQKGKTHSEETKRKISLIQTGRKNNYPKRKSSSEETKAKISATMKARFIGDNKDENVSKMSKAANARWNLELTQPPLMLKDYNS